MSANPVLIVGSVALDSVQTPSGKAERALGGAAVYSSVAASFFAPVRIVGVVGEDFPEEHIAFLRSRGIDTQGLQVVPGGKTFHWAGTYEGDMNQANTLATELNVFQDFRPELPEDYKSSEFVFLANIDPELQLKVLDQVPNAKLKAMDTMNFWISSKQDALREVIKRVDVVFINDAELRQLTGTVNITKAAAQVHDLGPSYVIVKKGEHGAVMYCTPPSPPLTKGGTGGVCFAAASYPLEEVTDPTGAGDSFAGGFMGYVASTGHLTHDNLRKAVVYGSTLASYNVQDFSLNRFKRLTKAEITSRYEEFKQIVFFESLG
jgi:sugar/nucleoside kinase (ribokinase family)